MSEEPAVYVLDGGLRLQRAREDALPEHTSYRDEGCELHDACLTCPLPRCRHDVRGGARTILNADRDREIRRCRDEELMPIDAIAVHFEVSRRTVFRALSRGRATGRNGYTASTKEAADATRQR